MNRLFYLKYVMPFNHNTYTLLQNYIFLAFWLPVILSPSTRDKIYFVISHVLITIPSIILIIYCTCYNNFH